MRSVEIAMETKAGTLDGRAMTEQIDRLEQRALHLWVPRAYGSSLYTMRLHIGLIRSHLELILADQNNRDTDHPHETHSVLGRAPRRDQASPTPLLRDGEYRGK